VLSVDRHQASQRPVSFLFAHTNAVSAGTRAFVDTIRYDKSGYRYRDSTFGNSARGGQRGARDPDLEAAIPLMDTWCLV
jgi:hypothetical protein